MGPHQEVMFEGDKITLDIPKEGIELENGWTIIPDIYPAVSEILAHQVVCRLNFHSKLDFATVATL